MAPLAEPGDVQGLRIVLVVHLGRVSALDAGRAADLSPAQVDVSVGTGVRPGSGISREIPMTRTVLTHPGIVAAPAVAAVPVEWARAARAGCLACHVATLATAFHGNNEEETKSAPHKGGFFRAHAGAHPRVHACACARNLLLLVF
jgi:hypothetical protein